MKRGARGSADKTLRDVGARYVPERRTAVFDLRVDEEEGAWVVRGETTEPAAVEALLVELAALARAPVIRDEAIRLPDPALGEHTAALVRGGLAPVHAGPDIRATQTTQYVLGHRLDLLSRSGRWWRVRGEDGYVGWVHEGYLQVGSPEWARQWEVGVEGEPAVSLGTDLLDEDERVFARVPWGARLIRDQPRRFRLPDGRRGTVREEGQVIAADRLSDRFPLRGESIVRTARLWWGTPYIWGGVTPLGADCSGFVQAVFWMHGVALPRDSRMQARTGAPLDLAELEALRPGDLLFFSDRPDRRVTHVAISLGGPDIIHCGLSNGGVEFNRVGGELELEQRLMDELVALRRVLRD
ncbi:MAG TPA: C40 family peptidase [Longimicrobiales bacterium]|nr:C40 family peptidase [Longimicrobiales bacterium]